MLGIDVQSSALGLDRLVKKLLGLALRREAFTLPGPVWVRPVCLPAIARLGSYFLNCHPESLIVTDENSEKLVGIILSAAIWFDQDLHRRETRSVPQGEWSL